jgi:antitoxin component YwqK of YwqJK toxin-antitoxin module
MANLVTLRSRKISFTILLCFIGCSSPPIQKPSAPVVPKLLEAKSKASPAKLDAAKLDNKQVDENGRKSGKYRLEFETFMTESGHSANAEKIGPRCKGRAKGDQPVGRWLCVSAEGRKLSAAWYSKGKLNGWVRTWFTTGKIESEAFWLEGVLNGPAAKYFSNGAIAISTKFKNGELNGLLIDRDDQGRKQWSAYFVGGVQNGLQREYYSNGFKKNRTYFVMGKKSGNYTEWYESGNIKLHGEYRDDRPIGDWQSWPDTDKAKPKAGSYDSLTSGENLQ